MKRLLSLLLLGMLLSWDLAIPASAATLQVAENNYIRDGTYANTAQNPTTGNLQVSVRGTNNNRKIYLSFDLASLGLTADQDFATASINLTLGATPLIGTATGNVNLNLYGIVNNQGAFDQSTITWANAPQNNTTSGTSFLNVGTTVLLLATVTIDSTSSSLANSTISWSSAALTSFLNSSSNGSVTLMIGSGGSTSSPGFTFLSSENGSVSLGTTPSLVYTIVPEPSSKSLAVVAMGFLGLVWVVSRKRGDCRFE